MNRMDPLNAASGSTVGTRSRAWATLVAGVVVCLGLAACGGGGGGGSSTGAGSGGDALSKDGALKVTVNDTFGSVIPGATVIGPRGTSSTNAQGEALLVVDRSGGSAGVTVSRASFLDTSITASLTTNLVNEVVVTLTRSTSAAGGSLASRSGIVPVVDGTAQEMTFEIELVVVDGGSQPIQNLGPANFMLRACTPDPANQRVDCVRGSAADGDAAYAPATVSPGALEVIAGSASRPYAAALLLDQTGSILDSDPTGARLFSAKAFLGALGADDRALLAAFAGGAGALIPNVPLALYGPFRDRASAAPYFGILDSLAPLVGGNTPLYESLDGVRQGFASDASLPAGLAKAVVIFTDGTDTNCGSPATCRTRRQLSIQGANDDHVRLFTIGLSGAADVAALGELANQTGGAFLYAETAEQLLPLYGSVGKLLSLSLPTYRLRWTVRASAPGAFQSGYTLLGRVQVTAGARSFDVPFIVGIP